MTDTEPFNSALELPSGRRPSIDEYRSSSLSVRQRFGPYEFAADGRNIHDEIVAWLPLQGKEIIVDVGCAEGVTLDRIRRNHPQHTGPLIGIDIDPDLLDT